MKTTNQRQMTKEEIKQGIIEHLLSLSVADKIEAINEIREAIHELSPFKNEPVDFVKWVPSESVTANDYNPNKVAPPEMELLEVSIMNDGYTQPVVTFPHEGKIEVVDGFHRTRVSKESKIVRQRVHGYTPTVSIRKEQSGKNDRIASTIRHNRARGKHQVDAMSEIVIELKNRNWTNARISKQLGMDEEEVLRLCQISGLEHLFSDRDFSRAWISEESNERYIPVHDKLLPIEIEQYRAGNTSDRDRVFHTWDKWECYKAGFYESSHPTKSHAECESEFVSILSDQTVFSSALERVIVEWKHSCEHYLTNKSMNRIAWLGQAAVCIHSGIPSRYSGSWFDVAESDRTAANDTALIYLNRWLSLNSRSEISLHEALNVGRQIELY
jgi:hypothetical protein